MGYQHVYMACCDHAGCAEQALVLSEHARAAEVSELPPEGWARTGYQLWCPVHVVRELSDGLPDARALEAARAPEAAGWGLPPISETEAIELHAYAALADGRVLRSPALENPLCAELYATQVLKLQLDPDKLIAWFGWTVEPV